MTEWEPATDAEVAMREALRTDDQESYFRILAGVDLLLPVSADALAGLAPLGWGTWSTGGRTHVLAFTSPSALQACLADYSGSARRVPYQELANTWPNLEWWLAVNPGLPIEGYLPAWFVAQLARGDLRLPTRAGRDSATAQAAQRSDTTGAGGPTPAPPAGPVPPATVPVGSPYGASAERGAPVGSAQATSGSLPARSPGTVLASGLPGGPQSGEPYRGAPTSVAPTSAVPAAYRPPVVPPRPASPAGPASPQGPVSPPGPNALQQPAATPAQPAPPSPAPSQPSRQWSPSQPIRPVLADGDRAAAFPLDQRADPDRSGGDPPDQERPGRDQDREPAGHGPAAQDRPGQERPGHGSAAQDRPGQERRDEGRSERGGTDRDGTDQDPADQRGVQQGATGRSPDPVSTVPASGNALPRRPVPPPSERPTSMAAAAQAMAAARTSPSPQPTRPGIVPPVIPGAPGGARPRAGTDNRPGADPGVGPGAGPDIRPGARPTGPGRSPSDAPASPGRSPSAPEGAERPPAAVPLAGAAADNDPTASESPSAAPADWSRPRTDTAATTSDRGVAPARSESDEDEFQPANGVEQDLYNAADGGSTDVFLSTLLLATVLVPVGPQSRPGATPGEAGFVFRTEEVDDEPYLMVFTSPDRLAEHYAEPVRTVGVRFFELIRNWPDPTWSFSVNPGSPIGAKLPGAQVIALANWATDAGLGDDPVPARRDDEPVPAPHPPRDGDPAQQPTIMQKTLPPEQVDYFLDRGYDRVAGFVHRAAEVAHLRTPAELHAALGLGYAGSPYRPDAKEAYVLRWPAYRPSLYRIPYGGQNEHALRAMDGWVIERAPFRGNGFAPGESRDVIAEFKLDSTRLPHGAQLWRVDADGTERIIAVFDADAPVWRRVGGQ